MIENKMIINFATVSPALVTDWALLISVEMSAGGRQLDVMLATTESITWGALKKACTSLGRQAEPTLLKIKRVGMPVLYMGNIWPPAVFPAVANCS
jgi:hypothetical protein